MEMINLMPIERRLAQRQRGRRMRWWSVCGVYASAALTLAPALTEVGAGGRELDDQQHRLAREIETAAQNNAHLAAEHARLTRQSSLTQELRGRADWGRLLGAVASTIGSDVGLERTALSPRQDGRGYVLRLDGIAVSQRAVNQTALRLEEITSGGAPLFDSVGIIDSRRRPIGAVPAVTFSIECALRERQEQAP